ncbi:MAG: hemagglutinin, partial [Colwellia sp.]|nr:hemagglutinin [Colwellia sp.]
AYGNRTTDTSNVSLAVQTGTGTLDGTTTQAAVAGLATFNDLSIDEADSFTLRASSGGLSTDDSSSFAVSAGSATQVVFTQEPTAATAGTDFSPTITAEIRDGSNNLVSSTANVTLSINSGTGTLNGTLTVAAVGGVATFNNININEAGSFTLDVDSSGLTTGTSASFAISAGSASAVAFVQNPTAAASGATISPSVTVEIVDAYGNRTTDTSNVSLAVQTGTGTLDGTT